MSSGRGITRGRMKYGVNTSKVLGIQQYLATSICCGEAPSAVDPPQEFRLSPKAILVK